LLHIIVIVTFQVLSVVLIKIKNFFLVADTEHWFV